MSRAQPWFAKAALLSNAPNQGNRLRKGIAIATLVASGAMLLGAPSAAADDTQCPGPAIESGGTYDNVVVPPGQICILSDSTVRGNVTALQDARLLMEDNTVLGNVEGDKAEVVRLRRDRVRENVTIHDGVGFCPSATLLDVRVEEGNIHIENMGVGCGEVNLHTNFVSKGNIIVEENNVAGYQFLANVLGAPPQFTSGGNFQVYKNKAFSASVVDNIIPQNLQCFDNDPDPVSFGNTAKQHQGECQA